ncbi:MAG: RDD family protein [Acidimicrobiia bacterium]|nr:RDD family protein [Acidimicrobiia bacterium]
MLLDDRITISTPEGIEIDLVLAGLGSRFLATLLDTLIQVGCILALAVVLGVVGGSADYVVGGWGEAFFYLSIFVLLFGYHIVFETLSSGRSPGKRAAGIRVVRLGGEPVGFLASAVRNTVRLLDFLPVMYGVGIFSIVASDKNQRVGDLAAGTIVVREQTGGVRTPGGVAYWASSVTVPLAAVETWDVSAITAEELRAVRHFVDRRLQIPWGPRAYLAWELASRLGPKVAGAPTDVHPGVPPGGILVAKTARS